MRHNRNEKGNAYIEFVLVASFFFMPVILGMVTVGIAVTRNFQVNQLTRDVAHMMAKGVDLAEYNVVGDRVQMANFEGNKIDDGHGGLRPERKQPWWDKGYFIDIFFITFFFAGVTIVIKRLPPSSWMPSHTKDH